MVMTIHMTIPHKSSLLGGLDSSEFTRPCVRERDNGGVVTMEGKATMLGLVGGMVVAKALEAEPSPEDPDMSSACQRIHKPPSA